MDFENDVIDPAWTLQDPAHVRIDTLHAHSGTHALHITLPAGSGKNYGEAIRSRKVIPSPDTLFARFYLYAAQPEPNHVILVQVDGADGTQFQLNILDKKFLTLAWRGGEHLGMMSCGGNCSDARATAPVAKWACVEGQFDGKTMMPIQVFVDGQLVGLGYNGKEIPVTPFTQVTLGYGLHYGDHADEEVWYDDVVFDSKRIGCD